MKKFKALKMAMTAAFVTTASVAIATSAVEHSLSVGGSGVGALAQVEVGGAGRA